MACKSGNDNLEQVSRDVLIASLHLLGYDVKAFDGLMRLSRAHLDDPHVEQSTSPCDETESADPQGSGSCGSASEPQSPTTTSSGEEQHFAQHLVEQAMEEAENRLAARQLLALRSNHLISESNEHARTTIRYLCPLSKCQHKKAAIKGYRSQAELRKHLHFDFGFRPCLCLVCEKRFAQPSDLNRHFRTAHTTNQPYECALCQARAADRELVRRHVRVAHFNLPAFKCQQRQQGLAEPFDASIFVNIARQK